MKSKALLFICFLSLCPAFSQEDCSLSITTTFLNNNGSDGNMFEVNALQNIFITGFSVNANGTGNIYIYSKSGSYLGSENAPGDWTLLGSASISGNPGNPVFVPLVLNQSIFAGSSRSFYITGDNTNTTLNYTDGTSEGSVYAGNADLTVEEGIGIQYPFGTFIFPRVFNGTIHYGKSHAPICSTIPTLYNDNNGNNGIMFDITAINSVNIEEIFADFITPFYGDVRIYTKPGSHAAFTTDSSGWTLLSKKFIVGPIANIPQYTGAYLNTYIAAGNTQAFYLVSNNSLSYDFGSGGVGFIAFSDANIQIKSGTGKAGLFGFDNNFPRNFNGTIGYCVSAVGVEEENNPQITIYPTLTDANLNIQEGEGTMLQLIEILDMSGKLVSQHTPTSLLNVEHLTPGIYILQIKTNKGVLIRKISKI